MERKAGHLLLTCLTVAVGGNAQNGLPDPSFNGIGLAWDSLSFQAFGYCVAVQPDGKVLVGGDFQGAVDIAGKVVRYTIDGALDTTFSLDGVDLPAIPGDAGVMYGIAVQPDGKIIACGTTRMSAFDFDIVVFRWLADGTPDPSFGIDGLVQIDGNDRLDVATGIALQPDGCILISAYYTPATVLKVGVLRLLDDGTLDASFATNGVFSWTWTSAGAHGTDIELDAAGRIYVSGTAQSNGIAQPWVARLLQDGTPDPTFGFNGWVMTNMGADVWINALALQQDGKVVLAGRWEIDEHIFLMRRDSSGMLDTAFGVGGTLTESDLDCDRADDVLWQPDGKILVVGRSCDTVPGSGYGHWLTTVRYDGSGTRDQTWGVDGIAMVPAGNSSGGYGVAMAPDGKIVLGGYTIQDPGLISIMAVRLLNDFALATSTFQAWNDQPTLMPDPVDAQAVLTFTLKEGGPTTLDLFDMQGRNAGTLFRPGYLGSGVHEHVLDLSALATGPYVLSLRSGTQRSWLRFIKS